MPSPEIRFDPMEEFRKNVLAELDLPERRNEGNPEKDLPKKLGSFLVDKGFITKIDMWKKSWGCRYEDKKIFLNGLPMPDQAYNYYIFRLGKNESTNRQLFPTQGNETDQYRFLHETSHAYQDYLMHKEFPENPKGWYDKVVSGEINSNLGLLFSFCFKIREGNPGKGLSTWGNSPDNKLEDLKSENALRAIEDANELLTMYLWNPQYLNTFLEYVSGNIQGYGDSNLDKDKLVKLSNAGKNLLKEVIEMYVKEMKKNIGEW